MIFYVDSIVVNEQFAMPVRTTSHIVLLMLPNHPLIVDIVRYLSHNQL
jgi:hypothetical protein